MRKINLTFLTCLAVTVAAFCTQSAFGQATPILNWDQTWQYFQEGIQPTNQGTAQNPITWRTNNYNDTAWLPGSGVLAYEDSPGAFPTIGTTLNRLVPNGQSNNLTYYFRTHFNFPSNPANAILFFTNVVDDGLILYLNGVRLYDIRVPQINPPWVQTAGGTPAEWAQELMTFTNTSLLRQGDNVIAVELHDTSLTSTDVAFGLAVGYRFPLPIVITSHPTNDTAFVGDTVDLSVEVTGDSPRYWWFRNGSPLLGPTNNPLLRLSNIQLTNAGTYHVVVSNLFTGARSSNAVITVVPDLVPPEFVNAVMRFDQNEPSNRVYAIFTEDVLRANNREPFRSATNINNYFLREVGSPSSPGKEIEVLQALPGTGSRAVRLTLATNIDCSKEYVLFVSNLTDTKTNIMVPDIGAAQIVGCVYRSNLVAFRATWNYAFAYEGSGIPNNWYETNYVEDGNWTVGPAPFAFSGECETNCFGALGSIAECQGSATPLSFGFPSYLFRHMFIATNLPAFGTMHLQHVIDDGAVFYLNGKELFRYNMTNAPLDFNAVSLTCREAECTTNVFNVDNLRNGTNVLAVRMHDCGQATGVDVMFGLKVDLVFTNFPTRIPDMQIRHFRSATGRTNIVSWQPRGWRLQTTTNLANTSSWVNVVGVSTNATSYTNSSAAIGTERQRYYRLGRP